MEGTIVVNNFKHTLYQAVSLLVQELPQINPAADVVVFVSVTTGTTERAFARDLNGERRFASLEDRAPPIKYVLCFQTVPSFRQVMNLPVRNRIGNMIEQTEKGMRRSQAAQLISV
jgi:hypothetical protein